MTNRLSRRGIAGLAALLGTQHANLLVFVTDYSHQLQWTGSAWRRAPGDLEHSDTFHIFGAIAQFVRALIVERTTAGLVEARRRGKKGGRPQAMKPADVAAARALLDAGSLPVRDIARRLNVSVATLYRHVGKRGRPEDVEEAQAAHA